jgi:hypothetical protein
MKDLIKKILKKETEEILEIPGLHYFPDGVEGLKNFIEKKKIKRWSLDDNLNLFNYKDDLTWIEGLVSVSGSLNLRFTRIKSLGNLQSVGGDLDLGGTQIESLTNLKSVGNDLFLNKFLSKKYTDKKIRSMISVDGIIYRP